MNFTESKLQSACVKWIKRLTTINDKQEVQP